MQEPSNKAEETLAVAGREDLWYKDAIIYELHVRAFGDSNADGMGDFQGLTEKLGYLQELGVTALWLLPFCPSPWRDDGYDIADYRDVHPAYGSLRDFKTFLREAHRRGFRVITELVINHTSDQHPWFQRARRARPGSAHRDYYVWSDTPERYGEARIIFQDFETSNWSWDPVAGAYYWHRFYHHQPDLNFDSPQVRREVIKILDFWFKMGVDGMRLDAIPYLFEREGTHCENLPETHAFLKQLRRHVDRCFPDRMLLAEANQPPADAVAYFGDGDECHMSFHFPVMPRLYMALRMEDRFPVTDILEQTPAIPDSCQWAIFLRNHDELTLEMVTDEDRDYMYRNYASDPRARVNLGIRRRLAPLLGNDRRSLELMHALLFALPGTPVLYYGDEIGMGDNIYLGDRDSVRTPMQWSPDRNAGFSAANPQSLYLPVITDPEYHYHAVNVEAQQANPHSLLWWVRRLIGLRKRHAAFGRGDIEFLQPENTKILAFIRRWRDERILMVANLSRFAQAVELDLGSFAGMVPRELFSGSPFPRVTEQPYLLTLGPHGFYGFALEAEGGEGGEGVAVEEVPVLQVGEDWGSCCEGASRGRLEPLLLAALERRPGLSGGRRRAVAAELVGVLPLSEGSRRVFARLAFVRVEYQEGEPETYALPLAFLPGRDSVPPEHDGAAVIAALELRGKKGAARHGLLVDASSEPDLLRRLLAAVTSRRSFRGPDGELVGFSTRPAALPGGSDTAEPGEPTVINARKRHTTVLFDQRFILKLLRRVEPGTHPELEVARHLAETPFAHTPPLLGGLEIRRGRGEPMVLALLYAYVDHQGDAAEHFLDCLGRYLERVLSQSAPPPPAPVRLHPGEAAALPRETAELLGGYDLGALDLLGRRTAQLHRALSSGGRRPAFAGEELSLLYRQSLQQSFRSLVGRTFQALGRRRGALSEAARAAVEDLTGREGELTAVAQRFAAARLPARRIRCHGDYRLERVLWTGNDFLPFGLEGDPSRPLSERRIKRSPLRDVAALVCSLHRVAHRAVEQADARGLLREGAVEEADRWAHLWWRWGSVVLLAAYREEAAGSALLPAEEEELGLMLDFYLLEACLQHLARSLAEAPERLPEAVAAVVEMLPPER